MLGPFHSWWHAGEGGAVAVYPYRKNMGGFVFYGVVSLVLFPAFFIYHHVGVFLALFVPIMLRLAADHRRAIIFTGTELVYRPAFANPYRIPFEDMVGVAERTVLVSFMLGGTYKSGLFITHRSGDTTAFEFECDAREEILKRLTAAIPTSSHPMVG